MLIRSWFGLPIFVEYLYHKNAPDSIALDAYHNSGCGGRGLVVFCQWDLQVPSVTT